MADNIKMGMDVDTKNSIKNLELLEKQLVDMKKSLSGLDKGSKEFNKLEKEIKETTTQTTKLNKELKTTSTATKKSAENTDKNAKSMTNYGDGIKNTLSQLGLYPKQLDQMSGAMKGISTATGTGTKAMKIFKMALASTGIGLLVIAVGSLIAYFKRTEEGAAKLQMIIAPFKILFQNIMDIAGKLGEKIVAVFENPKQAVIDLWEAIKKNIVVRIQSTIEMFGLLGKAISQVFKGEFSAAGDTAIEAGKKMVDSFTGVENSVDRITGAVTDLIVETQKESAIAIQSIKDKLALEQKQRKFLVDEAKLRAEIADKLLESRDITKSDAERLKALNDAQVLQTKLSNEQISIAEEKLRLAKLNASLSDSDADTLNEIAQLEADLFNIQKSNSDALKLIKSQANAIELKMISEVAAAKKKKEDDEAAAKKKALDDEIAYYADIVKLAEDAFNATLAGQISILDKQSLKLDKAYANGKITKEKYEAAKLVLEKKYAELSVEVSEKTTEEKMSMAQESIGQMSSILNTLSSLQDELMKKELMAAEGNEKKQDAIRKKYAEKKKKIKKAQIVMDMASAIIGTWSGYSSMGPFGTILAAIQTASILALGLTQIQNVEKTTFAKGGMLEGPSHASGGIATNLGEMEGGEAVINKMAMDNPNLRNIASAVNTTTGGKDFSTGDGSIKLSNDSISMIIGGINNKKVYVVESEMTEIQNKVEVYENYSTL